MHWPPDIADGLPAPRDDEPSSLRQDIADELADHLQCAFTRELHLTRDEQAAQQNTLHRFGDPRAIARKLWFDALREQIMSQRLTLALTSVMTLACMAASGLAWATFQEGRELNHTVLEKLESLQTSSTQHAELSSWGKVKVRAVIAGTSERAVGCRLRLSGFVYSSASNASSGSVEETVGTSGEVDFGTLPVGPFTLVASTPWGESSTRVVSVRSGRTADVEVAFPAKPPENATVRAAVNWPTELRGRNYLVRVSFTSSARKLPGDVEWATGTNIPAALIDPQNAIATLDDRSVKPRGTGMYRFPGSMKFHPTSTWTEGEYAVGVISVYQPTGESDRVLKLVASAQFAQEAAPDEGDDANSHGGGMGGGGGGGGFFNVEIEQFDGGPRVTIADQSAPILRVSSGEKNEWSIDLPEELVDTLLQLEKTASSTGVHSDH